MQDTELFLSMAEIAGVFVGFAALISVRSGGPSDAHEVTYIRSVVTAAIWVVIVALAPVIVSRYDLTGHGLWLACSLLALVLLLGQWIVNERTTESRELGAAYSRAQTLGVMAAYLGLMIPTIAALILVALGLFPDQEPALYLTAVGLGLFMGALTLLFLVFSQRRPATVPDQSALPATGGSGA
jgi:hypothetical protein